MKYGVARSNSTYVSRPEHKPRRAAYWREHANKEFPTSRLMVWGGNRKWVADQDSNHSNCQGLLEPSSSLLGWRQSVCKEPKSCYTINDWQLGRMTSERVEVPLYLNYRALLMPVDKLWRATDFTCQAQPKADISCHSLLKYQAERMRKVRK